MPCKKPNPPPKNTTSKKNPICTRLYYTCLYAALWEDRHNEIKFIKKPTTHLTAEIHTIKNLIAFFPYI